MGPLHLSKCKFSLTISKAIFYSVIDPVNHLSPVYGHTDMIFFFYQVNFVNSPGRGWNPLLSILNRYKTFIFSNMSKRTIWFFGVIGMVGYMVIIEITFGVLTKNSCSLFL